MKSDCVTLWIGDSLGPVERACFRSVLRQGHGLALYCYGEPAGVPRGVEIRDAAAVLPESDILYHRSTRSPALFSDWFRFELQRLGLGTWIDTDLYLIGPLDLESDYLLAEEEPGLINGSVLRLPRDSPILPGLLEPFERRITPDWLPWHHYLAARLRETIKGEADLSRLPWGSVGPYALTALARRHGLYSLAYPPEVFQPVPWDRADWILDPRTRLEDVATERTVGIHLANQFIKRFKDSPAPAGSFLSRLQAEGRD